MFFPTNSISLVGASQQINHVSKNSMQSHTSEHLQSLVDCKPIMHNSATADQLQAAAAAGLHAQHGSVAGSAGGSHGHNEFKYSASPFQIRQRTAFAPPPTVSRPSWTLSPKLRVKKKYWQTLWQTEKFRKKNSIGNRFDHFQLYWMNRIC